MIRAGVIAEVRVACDRFAARPALVEAGRVITYAELGARMDEAAARIAALSAEQFYVALERPHGADAIIEFLGILYAGRCAVPLDPAQPEAVRSAIRSRIGAAVSLGEPSPDEAVLYFTSGSTGDAKGVGLLRRTLSRAVEILQDMMEFTAGDRHALLSPLSVAASFAQVLTPLRAGAALHFFEARRHSTAELAAWLDAEEITTMQVVPSLFRALAAEIRGHRIANLRRVKLGGEAVLSADAKRFAEITTKGAVLVNGLGLTEAGFNVCWRTWRDGELLADGAFPIGRAARGVEISVEDSADGTGEIVVRSDAFPCGYWRDERKSAEVFRALPERPGWIELRTRDAGRFDADGELVHLGRLDQLVKIRGHRVELGAVEAAAMGLAGVSAAAIVVRQEGGATRLVLFVEVGSLTLNATSIRTFLGARLPDYAVPANVVVMEKFPRLAFGKIDRAALASRSGDIPVRASSEKKPGQECPVSLGDALERTLMGLFGRALRRKKIAATESFFDLGGDSLAAATLFADIARVLRVELPLAELRAHPSVEKLAARIRAGGWNLNDHPVALLTPSPDADAVNVFVWPGAGSDVLALAEFAQEVGSSVAFYGIQHRGADGRRVYDTSIAAMAERGEKLIRGIQPQGPWIVCGGSFGGVVALEVARRLRADGGEVFLVMFDTFAPGFPKARRGLSLRDRYRVSLRWIKPLGRGDERGAWLVFLGLATHVIRFVARWLVKRPAPEAPPLGMRWRYLFLIEACTCALRRYKPAPYDGPVAFFHVKEKLAEELFVRDDSQGWGGVLTGAVSLIETPGSHMTMMHRPNTAALAKKFRSALPPRGPQRSWMPEKVWDELAAWWDSEAGDEGGSVFRAAAGKSLEKLAGLAKGRRVLDAACGNGWLARRLARAGAHVVAVDISAGMLAAARARNDGVGVEYRRADLTRAESFVAFAGGFEAAVCCMALQDLSDIGPLFSGVHAAVKPGGEFFVSYVHPRSAARAGVEPNKPAEVLVLPGQPRPHIEVTRPLDDVLACARGAGWVVESVEELPSPESPQVAVLWLRAAAVPNHPESRS